jgi:hypothetical protein
VSLISGGLINPGTRRKERMERKRERRTQRREAVGLPPPLPYARERRRSRGDEPKGFIKKALTKVRHDPDLTMRMLILLGRAIFDDCEYA